MDYETICKRLGWVEWPNLKDRIHEPEIQASIQATLDAFDHYSIMWNTYATSQTAENNEACDYAEWCGEMADNQLCILVDTGKVIHKLLDPYPKWLRKKKYQEKIDAIVPIDRSLPDDVLDIISQYSKPAFIYFREYNQALDLFHLPFSYKQKLKEKIVDPLVRQQLKICIDAHDDYQKKLDVYIRHKTPLNEEFSDKSRYMAEVSKNKFVALLDEKEYHQQGYAAWYFQDDIDDAWMDNSLDEPMTAEEERLAQQEDYERYLADNEGYEVYKLHQEEQCSIDEIYDGLYHLFN